MVRLGASIAGGVGSIPAWETMIRQAAQYSQIKHTHTHTQINIPRAPLFVLGAEVTDLSI